MQLHCITHYTIFQIVEIPYGFSARPTGLKSAGVSGAPFAHQNANAVRIKWPWERMRSLPISCNFWRSDSGKSMLVIDLFFVMLPLFLCAVFCCVIRSILCITLVDP